MSEPQSQLDSVLRLHRVIFCCACLVIGSLYRDFLPSGNYNFLLELQLCILFVAFFGIAHGSLDYLPMIRSHGCSKRLNVRPNLSDVYQFIGFLLVYSCIALVFYGLWQVAAPVALFLFLLLSVIHFAGLETKLAQPFTFLKSITRDDCLALVIAGTPVLLPCGMVPGKVAPIISTLLGNASQTDTVLGALGLVAMCWISVLIFLVYDIISRRKEQGLQRVLENSVLLACLAFLALKVTPIVAFTIYFCGFHALEETIKLSHSLDPENFSRGFGRFLLLSSVPTFVVLWVATNYFFGLIDQGELIAAACSRVLFVSISCITVPHFAMRCRLFPADQFLKFDNGQSLSSSQVGKQIV